MEDDSTLQQLLSELQLPESCLPDTRPLMSRHALVGLIGHNATMLATGEKTLSVPFQNLSKRGMLDRVEQSQEEFRQGRLNAYECLIPTARGVPHRFRVQDLKIDYAMLDPTFQEPALSGLGLPLYKSINCNKMYL